MKGKVGVSCKFEYIFSGTYVYNKAYMKTIDPIFSFNNSDIAQFRLKVIEFYNKYGTKATIDAFSVKRRTIFYWKKLLKDSGGRLSSLIPKRKTPKKSNILLKSINPVILRLTPLLNLFVELNFTLLIP